MNDPFSNRNFGNKWVIIIFNSLFYAISLGQFIINVAKMSHNRGKLLIASKYMGPVLGEHFVIGWVSLHLSRGTSLPPKSLESPLPGQTYFITGSCARLPGLDRLFCYTISKFKQIACFFPRLTYTGMTFSMFNIKEIGPSAQKS